MRMRQQNHLSLRYFAAHGINVRSTHVMKPADRKPHTSNDHSSVALNRCIRASISLGPIGYRKATAIEVCGRVADKCQGRRGFTCRGCVKSEAGKSCGTLPVHKGDVEGAWSDAEDSRGLRVEVHHRTPDVGCRSSGIDKECVRPTAASKEVRPCSTIKHIGSAGCGERIRSRTRVNEDIGNCGGDEQVIRREVNVLIPHTSDGSSVWVTICVAVGSGRCV